LGEAGESPLTKNHRRAQNYIAPAFQPGKGKQHGEEKAEEGEKENGQEGKG
jgi:hypothetical protein